MFDPADKNWKMYQDQMKGERLKTVRRKSDNRLERRFVEVGPNHAWDCACMHTVRATVRGLLPDMEIESASDRESAQPEPAVLAA